MKRRKCKYCREPFEPSVFLQKNCFDPNCVAEWINDVKQKNWQKKKAKLKADLMTLSDYIKLAQQVFNKYIRLRDYGNLCISCQRKPLKENSGHFYNANNHWSVRFDERNVHLQCEHCNTFLSGNLIYYRENLLKKIGIEEFENLSAEAMKTRKFTIEELKEIIATYKKKCKEIELH
jgi:hypothetical protein